MPNPSLRHRLKPWLPPALVRIYRRRRGDPRADPQFTLPARPLAELWPTPAAAELALPLALAARADEWAMPAAELLAMAAICVLAQPRRVFEIGTYTGETTRVIARNILADARVDTLDLAPDEFARRVGRPPHYVAGSAFHGTPEAQKIAQHAVGAGGFDFAPFAGQYDLVFVDADHRYPAVKADSEQALRLARPGGAIVWDDYVWDERHPECAGVTTYLNELVRDLPIYRIAGTRLAWARV